MEDGLGDPCRDREGGKIPRLLQGAASEMAALKQGVLGTRRPIFFTVSGEV